MENYETFTEASLLWDPVALKWARPKNQLDNSSLRNSAYQANQGIRADLQGDIDHEVLRTLRAAGVDLSAFAKNSPDENYGRGSYSNLDGVNDYVYSALRETQEGLNSGYYSSSQFGVSDNQANNPFLQQNFQYKIPGKLKVTRTLDKVCMIYYVALSTTLLCTCQFLIFPLVYEDSPLTLRYRTWFTWYVFYNALINYVLVYIYSGPYEQSAQFDFSDSGLPLSGWNRCDECEQLVPPRTHHCPLCDKCVLKRDHHCFFTGSCIGFYNQRHFIVMCFYCAIGGSYAFYLLWQYCCLEYYQPLSADFWHYVFPATVVEWLVGRCSFLFVYLVLLFYLSVTAAGGAITMFLWQMYLVCCGLTTHEFTKDIKTYRGAPLREKIRSVFGHWYLVQFVIPMPLITIKGDGINWTHVAKKI